MDIAIETLNDRFKDDEFDVNKIIDYQNNLEQKLSELQKSVSFSTDEVPSKVSSILKKVDDCLGSISDLNNEVSSLDLAVSNHEAKTSELHKHTKDYMDKISLLEKATCYFKTLKKIEDLSLNIEIRLSERGRQPVAEYLELCSIANDLHTTACHNFLKYLKDTVHHWHTLLKERLSKDFQEVLKFLKWPFVGPNVVPLPSVDTIAKFQSLIETLINVQLPEWTTSETSASLLPSLSLPIILLLRPLKTRFVFHFSGSKQTNQSDKPEWYFTLILNWIKDHQDFVEKHVQPVYNKLSKQSTNARMEFIRGLVQLAVDKIDWDLPHLAYDDVLFSHAVDEALGFARELRDGYGYGDTQPSVINSLTHTPNFIKWIYLEKKYSLEKLDGMMRSPTAFQRNHPFDDAEFTTECTDRFLTLLSAITDRYTNLPQPGHRLQFLQLQLDLIDDFRVRLLQLLREQDGDPLMMLTPNVLNSINSLLHVLEEWSITPHFLQLNFFKNQLDCADKQSDELSSENSVFDGPITLFTNMQDDLLRNLTEGILIQVKARSRDYRKDRWHFMEVFNGLTPSSVPMFQTLTDELRELTNALTPNLRMPALLKLAHDFDAFLFEELVCLVHFSSNGAEQFAYDVRKNLLPLFGQYMTKPEAHFRLLLDSSTLLTLPKGSALLLKNAIMDPTENDYQSSFVLSNVGVFKLSERQALEILNKRLDLLENA